MSKEIMNGLNIFVKARSTTVLQRKKGNLENKLFGAPSTKTLRGKPPKPGVNIIGIFWPANWFRGLQKGMFVQNCKNIGQTF